MANPLILQLTRVYIVESVGQRGSHLKEVFICRGGIDPLAEIEGSGDFSIYLFHTHGGVHHGLHLEDEYGSILVLEANWVVKIYKPSLIHDGNLVANLFGFIYSMCN